MTLCRYCQGYGVLPVEQTRRERATRGAAAGKLPPFGRDVDQAASAGKLPTGGVDLFFRSCPNTGMDAWQLAAQSRELRGSGAAMVLPDGEDIAGFRWPAVPVQYLHEPVIVLWAYGMTADEEQRYGKALIAVGYDMVDVRGGATGPHRFIAQ